MPFTPNPEAEASASFDVVQPGVYQMRVKEIKVNADEAGNVKVSEKGNKTFRVELEYVDPSALLKIDGSPASNPGALFDYLVFEGPGDPKKTQGKLRSFVEACGYAWGELTDEQMLVGSEVDVKVKEEAYNGEPTNKVGRYLKK